MTFKFYWPQTWILLAFAPFSGWLLESQASEYNGHWSWDGFLLVTATFAALIALVQFIFWLLDVGPESR